jgi:hypothetical protein
MVGTAGSQIDHTRSLSRNGRFLTDHDQTVDEAEVKKMIIHDHLVDTVDSFDLYQARSRGG